MAKGVDLAWRARVGVRCGPVQRRGLLARDGAERRASLQQQLGGGEVKIWARATFGGRLGGRVKGLGLGWRWVIG